MLSWDIDERRLQKAQKEAQREGVRITRIWSHIMYSQEEKNARLADLLI